MLKNFNVTIQAIILATLAALLLLITSVIGFRTYSQLYAIILQGFDQELFALSTTTAAFIDADEHNKLLEAKTVTGLAWDESGQVLFGVDRFGYLSRISEEDGSAVEIGQTGNLNLCGLAFDPAKKMLYSIDTSGFRFLSINPANAETKTVGPVGYPCFGLAYDSDKKVLYASGANLYILDPVSGKGRVTGTLDSVVVNGLTWNRSASMMLGTTVTDNRLVRIQPQPFRYEFIGTLKQEPDTSAADKNPAGEEEEAGEEESEDSENAETIVFPNYALAWIPSAGRLYGATDRLIRINDSSAEVSFSDFVQGYRNAHDEPYLKYVRPMQRIKDKKDITYLYTNVLLDSTYPVNRFSSEDKIDFKHVTKIAYVLDATHPDSSDYSPIGFVDANPTEPKTRDVLLKDVINLSDIKFWDQWGLIKTGIAPIYNRNNESKAITGVDINISIINYKTREALIQVIIIGLIAFFLSIAVSVFIARRLTRPIAQLKEAALRVAAGQYDQTIPVQEPRELGELSGTFNHMSQTLDHTLKTIRKTNYDLAAQRRKNELVRAIAEAVKSSDSTDTVIFYPGNDVLSPDAGGCVNHDKIFFGWLSSAPQDPLEAVKIRSEIAMAAGTIIRHYDGNADTVWPLCRMLRNEWIHTTVLYNRETHVLHGESGGQTPAWLLQKDGRMIPANLPDYLGSSLPAQAVLVMSSESVNWDGSAEELLARCLSEPDCDVNQLAGILQGAVVKTPGCRETALIIIKNF